MILLVMMRMRIVRRMPIIIIPMRMRVMDTFVATPHTSLDLRGVHHPGGGVSGWVERAE